MKNIAEDVVERLDLKSEERIFVVLATGVVRFCITSITTSPRMLGSPTAKDDASWGC